MNIKNKFGVAVAIIVIQLTLIRASDENQENSTQKNLLLSGDQYPSAADIFFKDQIIEMRHQIEAIQQALAVTVVLDERASYLESAIEILQKEVDGTDRENRSEMDSIETYMYELAAKIEYVKRDLQELKRRFEETLDLQTPTSLRKAIVEDIIGRDFVSASNKFRNLTDQFQKNINIIVSDVYSYRRANFEKVLRFATSDHANSSINLAIFEALEYEMELNGDFESQKMFKVLHSLNDLLVSDSLTPTDKDSAEKLASKLRTIVVDKTFTSSMFEIHKNDFVKVSEIYQNIFLFNVTLFEEIIFKSAKVLPLSYDEYVPPSYNIKNLINFFRNIKHQEQSIFGFSAIFNGLQNRTDLYDEKPLVNLISVAIGLRESMNATKDLAALEKGKTLKNHLPESVRHLAFSDCVRIKNKKFNEYLYAANDTHLEDHDASRVFTWNNQNETMVEGAWAIEEIRTTGAYLIKNIMHKEYLSVTEPYNSTKNVYTSTACQVNQCIWIIEPSGNDVYIRSDLDEYLSPSENQIYDDDRHDVHSLMHPKKTEAILWTIENCDYNNTVINQ